MSTRKFPLRAVSIVLACALVLSLVYIPLAPASRAYAEEAGTVDPAILDIQVNKPAGAAVLHDPASISMQLPYGSLYQMLNVSAHPDAEVTLYREDAATVIPFTTGGLNNGDARLDQFSANGSTTYFLDVAARSDSSISRTYTVTVSVYQQPPAWIGSIGPNDKLSPLNIAGGEHAWDVMGSSLIGNGSTTGAIEGPNAPSSYSGMHWSESYYDRSGDYPAAAEVDESWVGDHMYLQTIGRQDVNALTKYGIADVPGDDMLQSDILRFHVFKPFETGEGVSRDDGDRGRENSDRQRLEIKSSTSGNNANANSMGGDIMTHRWKLMLPAETLRFLEGTSDDQAGDYIIPRRFWHIFQLKEIKGNAAGQPVTTLSLVSSEGKGHLEFRNNPDGSYADRIKPLFTIPFEQIENRWLDFEVTILTADKGYVYGKLVDLETGNVLFEGGMTAETYRRPEVTNGEGRLERGDLPVEPGQQNRSKWGLYRGMYNGEGDAAYADELQPATMYLSDVLLIKRDKNSYVFPDGWNPGEQEKDIAAWARPGQVTAPQGTPFGSLQLPAQLDVTLSTGRTEPVDVLWSSEGYQAGTMGAYTIEGEFAGAGIVNTKSIKPTIIVEVTEAEEERRNWAASPGAEIKVVSRGSNQTHFIDDNPDTYWIANSSLITPDAGEGRQYWAAVKLERKIDVENIELKWTNNSNYLNNYQTYYANEGAAYDELVEGHDFRKSQTGTKEPLLTENGALWLPIDGAGQSDPLSSNAEASHVLEEPVAAQYVLIVADVNQGRPSNEGYGVRSNEFRIIGTPSGPDEPGDPDGPADPDWPAFAEKPNSVNLLAPSRFTPQSGVNVKVSSESAEHPGTDALLENGEGYWRNSGPNVYMADFSPSSLSLTLDLGAPKTIDRLYLELPNTIANIQKNARRFEVYYTNDPEAWESVPGPTDEAADYDWRSNGWEIAGGTETEGLWSNVMYNDQQWGYDKKTFQYPFTARYVMLHTILVGPADRRIDDAESMMGISGLKIYGRDPVQNATALAPEEAAYSTWDQEAPVSTVMTLSEGQTLISIAREGEQLETGSDYSLSGSTVTFSPAYLAKLPLGTNAFTFQFNEGEASVFLLDVTARGYGDNEKTIVMSAIDGVSPFVVFGGAMETDEPVEGLTKRIRDGFHAYYGDHPRATAADDHIVNVWDEDLKKDVFQFSAQGTGPNDEYVDQLRDGEYAHKGVFDPSVGHVVGGADVHDRQRIELRPSEDSTGDFVAYDGDIVTYKWKWNIPDGEQWNQSNFRHLFQLKATNSQGADTLPGGNSGGENGPYILAMSIRGKDTRELQVNHNRHDGDKTILRIPMEEIGSHWLDVELNALISDTGWLNIKITDTETGKVYTFDSPDVYKMFPQQGEGDGVQDLWRRPIRNVNGNFETEYPAVFDQYLRPKWGIYRSAKPGNSIYDVDLKLADITIGKTASGVSPVNLALNKRAYNVGSTEGANAVQLAAAANPYGLADRLTNGVPEDPTKWNVDHVTSLEEIGEYSWLGTDGARKGSFVIDLGEMKSFSQLRLFAKSTRLKGVNVYVSGDAEEYGAAAEFDHVAFTMIPGIDPDSGYTYTTGNRDGGVDTEDSSYPIDLGRTYQSRYIKVTVENASGGNEGTDLTGPPLLTQVQVFNAPAPPQNLVVMTGEDSLALKWDANAASEGYTVYNGSEVVAELPGDATGYTLPEEIGEWTSVTVRTKGTDPYSRKFMISAPAVPVEGEDEPGTNPGTGTGSVLPPIAPVVRDGVIELGRDASITRTGASDGTNVAKVKVYADRLEDALTHPSVLISVEGSDSAVEVELPAEPIREAIGNGTDTTIIVEAGGIRYKLPIELFASVDSDSAIIVRIAKMSGEESEAALAALESIGAGSLLSHLISFEIMVDGSALGDFGGLYVERTIRMEGQQVDSDMSTAVWIDANYDIHFVPAVFQHDDEGTTATIKSPHNSLYTIIQSDISFEDMTGHWARADVELLANKRIVKGRTSSHYAPEDSVTRAEFAAMLARALGLPEAGEDLFSDVGSDDWFYGAVGAASRAGLVNGFSDGTFDPHAVITREQMAVMVARAMDIGGVTMEEDGDSIHAFADASEIGDWSKAAVTKALSAGLLQGKTNGAFAPGEQATRVQAAVVLKRLLQLLQFID
ncbi:S-layer homology domain-containing protein [Paenibacillus sp. J5C_2022]|uniref:S-layer homology domain-containing protein n=1 Tax=Paenibacillus sp. J5C2022 TaxID=2977129 RepID=UPI0021D2BDBC|nr:S-layer homology domain-containing protein [Paenibacillus sp. J5C2022]MCU6712082.1 S-layer homology domain-containing protein [Paenibacillus sp. J5C2022]